MRRLSVTLLAMILGAGTVAGQQPARGPGSQPQTGSSAIAGTVLTADGGQPVRRALVTINGGGLRNQRQTVTDSAGRFVVPDLPQGSFNVSVSKPAFIRVTYGAKQPSQPGTPVVLTPGQRATIDLRMSRGAVRARTVTDQFGRPRPQVRVVALGYRMAGGQRRLQQS